MSEQSTQSRALAASVHMASSIPQSKQPITRTLLAARMKDMTGWPCGSPGIARKKRGAGCKCTTCTMANLTPTSPSTALAASHDAALVAAAQEIGQPAFQGSEPRQKRQRTPPSYASSSFSPSDDPEAAAFFGRRQTRKIYGQNPDLFTPVGGVSRRHRQK